MRTYDLDKINELIHFMKIEPFSKSFADYIKDSEEWCAFHHDDGFNQECYFDNPLVQCLLNWTEKYLFCCKYLDVNKYSIDSMADDLEKLKIPIDINDYEDFSFIIQDLKGHIAFVESDIYNKLSHLACTECQRLDEALVCFKNYCFYSAVVMAVSAVEYRIAEIIKRSDEKLFLEHFQGATLGQLIKVFQDDEYKDDIFEDIKALMPNKHKPLVSLLNNYRVFAAHPTEEKITPQTAEAIIHLSFSFLIDFDTCPYDPKEMICYELKNESS